MRDGWTETTLGEVATRRKDFTPVVADALYRVVGVQRSGWGLVDRPPVRGDSMKFDKLLELHTDDLVYRTITAFEAPSAVVPREFDGAYVTPQTFPTYTIDRGRLLPGFMALLTTAPEFHEAMSTRCVGSVLRRKTLSQGAFESIPITLPPLAEQRRIVDLIAAVDDAAAAAEAEAARTRSLEASITAEHFASIEHAERLGALATSRLGKMLSKAANQGEDAPYLRNVNVRWGSIDTSDLKTMPFTEADHTEFALNAGDVLVCEGGEIARAAVLDEDLPGIYFQKAIHRVRCGARLRPHYLQRFLAHAVQNDLLADYVSGSTIKHLTGEKLAQVPVPLAELEDQDRLIARTEALRGGADAARDTAEALRTLRSNLLTVLLSGEHEIPSSYDALLGEVA